MSNRLERENAEAVYSNTVAAIDAIKAIAEKEQKQLHSKHIAKEYRQVLDILDLKLTSARAALSRYGK